MAEHWTHHDPAVRELIAEHEARVLRECAQEFWRVFLRLPHTPSPLGDYLQRRVLALRERADALDPPKTSGPAYESGPDTDTSTAQRGVSASPPIPPRNENQIR